MYPKEMIIMNKYSIFDVKYNDLDFYNATRAIDRDNMMNNTLEELKRANDLKEKSMQPNYISSYQEDVYDILYDNGFDEVELDEKTEKKLYNLAEKRFQYKKLSDEAFKKANTSLFEIGAYLMCATIIWLILSFISDNKMMILLPIIVMIAIPIVFSTLTKSKQIKYNSLYKQYENKKQEYENKIIKILKPLVDKEEDKIATERAKRQIKIDELKRFSKEVKEEIDGYNLDDTIDYYLDDSNFE